MATVTPNFNWPVPTSTDLVKDGATAIEALGDSIDASLVDLKGGTTGQVLSKNSNTDMDFVWVTDAAGDITGVTATSPLTGGGTSGTVTVGIQNASTTQSGAVQLSDSTSSTSTTLAATANAVKTSYDLAAGAIPKSLIDAAGDLIVGTAADTAGRLGIGSTGQVLTVSGGTAVWATAGGGSTGPSFSAKSTPSQSISANTATKATLANENWDTNNNFASSRFTPTVAGYYQINGAISYVAGSGVTVRCSIYKNGSSWQNGASFAASAVNPTALASVIVYCNGSTDYVELYGFADASGCEFYSATLDGAQVRS